MSITRSAVTVALVSAPLGVALAQAAYSEKQMRLARHIGVVTYLSDLCGARTSQAGIQAALKAEGLRQSDIEERTGFRDEIDKQKIALASIIRERRALGTSEDVVMGQNCHNLGAYYGPRGSVRRGLVVLPNR